VVVDSGGNLLIKYGGLFFEHYLLIFRFQSLEICMIIRVFGKHEKYQFLDVVRLVICSMIKEYPTLAMVCY